MSRPEVESRIRLGRSALYRLLRSGGFPLPIKIGRRAVRWRASEVEDWIASRPRATGDRPA